MNKTNLFVGIFVTAAIVLFGVGLFLIGNQNKAFRHHLDFYTDFANVDGISKGAKVRVDGMDGGQVESIQIPGSPAQRFRLKLQVDGHLRGLIRDNSIVTVETDGLVGDKFLLIHDGTAQSPLAAADSTLHSKEPFQMAKLLEQASGVINQANNTMVDVRGKLDGALDAVTSTVNNTNGVVTDIRHGHGAAGMLLEDRQTADQVRQILLNSKQATANIDTATVQVNDLLNDFQSRHLFVRAQHTLDNANGAAQQLKQASEHVNQASQQVNQTLTQAFADDQYGNSAGANLQQSLSNVNQATGNLADDTAALKQEFFFRGFFKKRGYDSLDDLPVSEYRSGKLFKKLDEHREWLASSSLFERDKSGRQVLSPAGREQIDQAASQFHDLYTNPILLEGYAQSGTAGEQLLESRRRATLVRAYLEIRFHLQPKDLGVVALSATPPAAAGRSTWDGVCLVQLAHPK